ncbi:thaumatin-like protein 1 [Tasmannia lanceolata]|uniref:thaumatin-like protein 1 n=1 Tax=Tasmannia lanceolata TaxID=3420 RepID=UPI0040640C5C
MKRLSLSLPFLSLPLLFFSGVLSASFTFTNNCQYPVWPGILPNSGTAPLSSSGFALQNGESNTLSAPSSWSGRFWGRTLCSQDSTGKFSCMTADCGSGNIECSGGGAAPPVTLAEFTLSGTGGLDFYDVSLVDGYNIPMLVVPENVSGAGNCTATGCLVDLNGNCPSELRVSGSDGNENVACKSACEAFGEPQYCCSGTYGNPNMCKPTSYSEFFKHACPRAYSYAYDDGTSTFTCYSADYVITFCPSIPSQKSSGGNNPEAAELPLVNSSMIFMGGEMTSHVSPRMHPGPTLSLAISVAILARIWPLPLF